MHTRTLMIAAAAAIAVTAIAINAPVSAATLTGPSQMIGQSTDSPIIQVGNKGGGHKHGKWHGHKHGKWHGKHYGHKSFYHFGNYVPYSYGGCYQQVYAMVGGYYVLQTINVCY